MKMDTDILFETWVEVKGFEGRYAVSTRGRVMSLERKVCNTLRGRSICHVIPEGLLRQHDSWQGYKQVWLRKPGLSKKMRVHRLVAEAFLPNPDDKPIVNHMDGDKGNCLLSNLEWATSSENTKHYYDVLKPVAAGIEEPIRPEDLPF